MSAPKFKVGQVWKDRLGHREQTVIAVTSNLTAPVVTQDDEGDVWSYRADGSWPTNNANFDLVRLVRDVVPTDAEQVYG
jgi:hypothetical protein